MSLNHFETFAQRHGDIRSPKRDTGVRFIANSANSNAVHRYFGFDCRQTIEPTLFYVSQGEHMWILKEFLWKEFLFMALLICALAGMMGPGKKPIK